MEDLNLVELGLAVLAVLLPVGFIYLRKLVKSTETQVDDKVLAAFEKAMAESKKDAE